MDKLQSLIESIVESKVNEMKQKVFWKELEPKEKKPKAEKPKTEKPKRKRSRKSFESGEKVYPTEKELLDYDV